jgi:hypothetical protein
MGSALRIILFWVTLISWAFLFVRSVPLLFAVPFAVGATVAFVALSRRGAWPWNPLRPVALNAMTFAVSLVVSLGAAEGVARIIIPPRVSTGVTTAPHPEYAFDLLPNSQRVHEFRTSRDAFSSVDVTISSQGFRDRVFGEKEAGEFRILMLGDSYTEGPTTELDQTVPKVLEAVLADENLPGRVSVVNAGMGGASTWQELGILRDRGLALNPDLVILQLYMGNDICDVLAAVGKHCQAYDVGLFKWLSACQIVDSAPVAIELWAGKHLTSYRTFKRVTGNRMWIGEAIGQIRFVEPFRMPPAPPSAPRSFMLEPNLREWYPDLHEGLGLLKGHVRQMREECLSHGIDFMMYCSPEIDDVKPGHWTGDNEEYRERYENGKAIRLVRELAEEEGIPYIDVVGLLRSQPDTDEVYFVHDGHLKPHGNRLVVDRIKDFLLSDYALGRRMGER